jgi:NitT/TauT family transport system substrate-binding protein
LAAKKIGIEPQTFLIAEAGYNPYTTVLATSERYLKSNPQIVKSMIEATRAGWERYLSDATKTNEHMANLNPTMPMETFTESAEAQKPLIQTADTKQSGIGTMTNARWRTLAQQLLDLKIIQNVSDPEAVFVDVSK